ncbi:MAG: hypothetical protein R3B13_10095 [Polyangiaceae bacterium]
MLKISTMRRLLPIAAAVSLLGCSPIDGDLFQATLSLWEAATRAVIRMSVLFVVGVVLFALAPQRMEKMQSEVAARPMHCFALGLVATLGGAVLAVALCVTVIGIPVALAGVVFAALFGYAGVCAVLATVGGGLWGHRIRNPYAHLGIGAALWLMLGALPWLGEALSFGLCMVGIGAVLGTRFAGLLDEKRFVPAS